MRKAEFERSIRSWLLEHTTAEVLELATGLRIPVAPIGNGELLPGLDHLVERGVFLSEPYTLTAPRPPYAIDGRSSRCPTSGSDTGGADFARGAGGDSAPDRVRTTRVR